MNREDAIQRATREPTPAGKPITSDETFNLFAALMPDSPWSARLLKIRDIFNQLATAATIIKDMDPIGEWEREVARNPDFANDPDLKKLRQAFTLMIDALGGVKPTLDTTARMGDMLPPVTEDESKSEPAPNTLHRLAKSVGGMRYNNDIPHFGRISGWSFKDDQLLALIDKVRSTP